MSTHVSPVDNIHHISLDLIEPNNYNPNHMGKAEMQSLELSIWTDGFTMPIVCYYDTTTQKYIIIDGYHRWLTVKNSKRINKRENNTIPVALINKPQPDIIAATIRHNRARGQHSLPGMVEVIALLKHLGQDDNWIMHNLRMTVEEILRLSQNGGVAEMHQHYTFTAAENDEIPHPNV